MHAISSIRIQNFRSCRRTQVTLHDFTAIVGYNNAGKSNILSAIEWLLAPYALSAKDFCDEAETIEVEGRIEGITEDLLGQMPTAQSKAVSPFVVENVLRIRRRLAVPGTASQAKVEIRDPSIEDELSEDAWRNNPIGIEGALKALFPAPIRIHAMENAGDDVGKASKTNTIGRLIAAVTEPVKAAHETEFLQALHTIRTRLAADGSDRAAELQILDGEMSAQLNELFPGLSLRVDISPPELPDLFKAGTVQVIENESPDICREFESVGHGAQRCIQMALIRHLAAKNITEGSPRRTLLLIDEPELYLHPQGVEQVRLALKRLSENGYQVVFSTHSPSLLTRDSAPTAVIVRKSGSPASTTARNPLVAAAAAAIQEAAHQSRLIFELGRAAEVFFSDRVLLGEGKTEERILPAAYETLRGTSLRADRLGLVGVNTSTSLVPALRVLREMEIEAFALADLDFAFRLAAKHGLIDENDADLRAAMPVLTRLAASLGFAQCAEGFPRKNAVMTAAEAWAHFATDPDGREIANRLHSKLLPHQIWLWKAGTIEDVLGGVGKGEEAIQRLELTLPTKTASDIRTEHPELAAMLDWFSTPIS